MHVRIGQKKGNVVIFLVYGLSGLKNGKHKKRNFVLVLTTYIILKANRHMRRTRRNTNLKMAKLKSKSPTKKPTGNKKAPAKKRTPEKDKYRV